MKNFMEQVKEFLAGLLGLIVMVVIFKLVWNDRIECLSTSGVGRHGRQSFVESHNEVVLHYRENLKNEEAQGFTPIFYDYGPIVLTDFYYGYEVSTDKYDRNIVSRWWDVPKVTTYRMHIGSTPKPDSINCSEILLSSYTWINQFLDEDYNLLWRDELHSEYFRDVDNFNEDFFRAWIDECDVVSVREFLCGLGFNKVEISISGGQCVFPFDLDDCCPNLNE